MTAPAPWLSRRLVKLGFSQTEADALAAEGDVLGVLAQHMLDAAAHGEVHVFTYTMPAAQTTATIDHDLGRDPVAVQVTDSDGIVYSEYEVVNTVPQAQVRIGFDVAIQATIRLL